MSGTGFALIKMAGAVALAGALCSVAHGQSSHPLDALTPDEYVQVAGILSADDRFLEGSLFPLIELIEPEKSIVIAWNKGDPLKRRARALIKSSNETSEVVIDLGAGTVESWIEATGEPMVMFDELIGAVAAALSDERMIAGLTARGLTPEQVYCVPLTAGNFFDGEADGRRLIKVPCYIQPQGTSNWNAQPIEGLFATVDVNTGEVLKVSDTGVVPVAGDTWGYTDEEIHARYGLRPESKMIEFSQEGGPNYSIDGSVVEWDMWRFHVRADKRPGLVISAVEAKDGDDWRSVLYQVHLSEVFVPYMDPDQAYYWRTFMDSGEYGFGLYLSPLSRGTDCPRYSSFLPVGLHTDRGKPLEIPDAICIFERRTGDAAWRHFEELERENGLPPYEGRPSVELVVRSAVRIGNYDYFIDYIFQQDAKVRIMIGATGLVAVKGVAATSMNDVGVEEDTRYGSLIAPNLVAPNHDHFFNFRLDFDIDGQENNFLRTGIVPANVAPDAIRRSLWVTETTMPMTEDEATYRVSYETPAIYHVGNLNVFTGLGHNPSYAIAPLGGAAFSPLDIANDPPMFRNAYIDKTYWVTPYDPSQRWAGGEYAFQSDGSDTLAEWIKEGRSIDNTDIVIWTSLGFHHIPMMEDWPVMSVMWKGLVLAPFNFFDHNPAITIRSVE